MQNNNTEEANFQLRPRSEYDRVQFVLHDRKQILDHALMKNPKQKIKGGTALTNPYKQHFDMVIAEKRLHIELLEKSKLWSPRFTKNHFKFHFGIPVACGLLLVTYLHFIQIPRRMLYWKKREKFDFPQLEKRGFLQNWIEDEYADEFYPDEIQKEFGSFKGEEDEISMDDMMKRTDVVEGLRDKRTAEHKDKLQGKLSQVYNRRKQLDKETA